MIGRLTTAIVLLGVFLVEIAISGAATAWMIVRPGRRPSPALVRMPLADLDDTGAAILGSIITLTPGTTTIDIDVDRRQLLLHLLDGSNPEAVVRGIQRSFEARLLRLFPAERSSLP